MLFLSTKPVVSWGVGGPTASSGISHSLPLRTGVLALILTQQGKTKVSVTWEFTETGLLCQVRDYGGFHWLRFKTLSCCWGTFCSGLKARTLLTSVWMYQQWVLLRAATDKDRQAVFPLGLAPVRFSPSEPVWLIFSAKGKTTSRKTQIFSELTHAKLRLEANLKASFWVTHASPSLLVLPTSHHDFYIKSHKWS